MTQKPRTFFTADTHFGHRRIIELCKRPFADVIQMREEIIRRWNERVGPDDVVWHLGDFAYRATDEEIESVFHRLNGTKHLVMGNHDGTATKMLPWASKTHLTEISVNSHPVVLCHYPLLEWRGFHRGTVHLFGHVHGRNPGVGRSCDVGVDCWDFRPVEFEEITSRLIWSGRS